MNRPEHKHIQEVPVQGTNLEDGNHLIRLAVVSGLLRLYPLDLAFAKIREAGYEGVELWGGQFHGYILDMVQEKGYDLVLDENRVAAIKSLCDKHGLQLVCYTPEQCIYPINYLMHDVYPFDGERLRNRSRQLIRLSIEAAAALGCGRMVLVSPLWHWRQEGDSYTRVSKREAVEAAIGEVEQFVRYAESRGVVILFEPLVYHDSNAIETLGDTAALMERIPSPSLQLLLDTGHIHVTATRLGYEPIAYFRDHLRRFAERLGHVHVDDNMGQVDSHLLPGVGVVDNGAMITLLKEHGYQGWISVELTVLGDYVLPERAEELLRQARLHMAGLLASNTS